ncbi:MAG: polysaccharide biosynthesis tyrosine autokinase [Planctomycetes bacterium]|nr:polysaccharide biosynthesis tyrosine autokinase [Planctomycetota bacterium]
MNKPMPLSKVMGPLSPSATPGVKVLTWREIVGMFRRRLWLTIIVTGLSTIIAAGWFVAAYTFNIWPGKNYTSYAQIECEMPIRDNPLTGIQLTPHRDIIELETRTLALYLTNDSFLASVLRREEVKNTKSYMYQRSETIEGETIEGETIEGETLINRLKKFKRHFGAVDQRNSNVVTLSMTTPSATESKVILDELLRLWEQNITEQAEEELRGPRSALDTKRKTVLTNIDRMNVQLVGILSGTNEPGFEEGQSSAWDEYKLMHNEKLILEAQINDATAVLQNMKKEIAEFGYSSSMQVEVENNPRITLLSNRIVDQESNLAQIRERLGADHQSVKQARASINGLNNQLESLRLQLLKRYSDMQKIMIERDLSSKQKLLEDVKAKYEKAESDLQDLNKNRADYLKAQSDLEDLKAQLRRLDDRIYEMDALLSPDTDFVSVTARVRFRATEPLGISSPRPIFWIPGGFFLGLMLSVGLILMLEFVDDSVKSPSDVRRYLNIPLLGMIPRHEDDNTDLLNVAKIAYTSPQAMISEAFRQVRTNLYFSAPVDELKTILVTSSSAGCGKTTVAANLAITLATEGKRILLVDANFRRAAINHLFGAEGPPRGLSNILVGQVPAAEAIRQSEVEGLDLVDAGPVPPNPAVLLSGSRMKDFLENQKQYYDHIILDGPPMLVVTDARIIASMVDGTIAVVHAGDTSRGVVQRMMGELKNNQVNILGVLLNAVRALKGGYFSESYRSYYEYIGAEMSEIKSMPPKPGHDLVES